MASTRASCLCGGVRFEIDRPLSGALNCHCGACRKAQGSAFRSRASADSAAVRFATGADLVTYFESSPGVRRGFCSRCGSPIMSRFDARPEVVGIPLGVLDDDPVVRPAFHVHVESKAVWHEISDDLPQYARIP